MRLGASLRRMRVRGPCRRAALAVLLAVLTACVAAPRWRLEENPTRADAAILLSPGTDEARALRRDALFAQALLIPVRERLRPCCAFGAQIGVKLGPFPIPGYRIPNLLGPADLGRHTYDSGVLRLRNEEGLDLSVGEEHNGLVYTCRGGFIDTAHVRDYADWMLYVAAQLYGHLFDGERFELILPEEGGSRRIRLAPVDPAAVDQIGVRPLAIWLARWAVFQMSIWHEIATWFGYRAVPGFSERSSAFSPEDLYSNLLGVHVTAGLLYRHGARTERVYNRSVDAWFARILEVLGGVPRKAGLEAAMAVEGLWWDAERRVPDNALVMRRNLEIGERIAPWLVPPERVGSALEEALRASCGEAREPLVLDNEISIDGIVFSDLVTFEVEVDDALLAQEPFASLGRTVTQRDFPAIVERVREQARSEFGPAVDRPD